jgi:hypothetical protein
MYAPSSTTACATANGLSAPGVINAVVTQVAVV